MKKLFPLLLLLMMLAPAALAEQGTVTFLEVTVPTDCTYVDLGTKAVRDLDSLEAFLDQLPQLEIEQPAPAREEARVEEIGENVMAAFAAQQAEDTASEEPVEISEETAAADDYPMDDPFAREDLDATRRINLDDLKFGRNYTGE